MPDAHSRNKFMWLTVGALAGMCLSYFWPHEPAYATTSDRDADFVVFTSPNVLQAADTVFVLDFVTGQLKGAAMNNKTAQFTNFYQRNVAQDFDVDAGAEPHYAIVSGIGGLPSKGRYSTATGIVYVAELNSGLCIGYAYQYRESTTPLPAFDLAPADQFRWRDPM